MHCTMSAGKTKTEIIMINLKEILCLPSTVCFFLIPQSQNLRDDVQSGEVTTG